MELFIIILLTLVLIGGLIFFQSKIAQSKHQLIVLTRQVDDLRSKVSSSQRRNSRLLVKYLIPENRMGLTNANTNLFISPLDDSPVLQKLTVKMEVTILDKASVKDVTWFYVRIPSDDNINCRGWVKQTDFSLLYDTSKAISKTY